MIPTDIIDKWLAFAGATDEEWRSVIGYEEVYEVSDQGRIRSLNRKVNSRDQRQKPIIGQILRPRLISGYWRVKLSRNGKAKHVFVHLLVAEAFVNAIPPGCQVDHIDGNKENNVASNLRICLPKNNSWNRMPLGECQYKGVCLDKRKGKWQARIVADAHRLFLGYFDTPEDAALAYDIKAIELHGNFARLNCLQGASND